MTRYSPSSQLALRSSARPSATCCAVSPSNFHRPSPAWISSPPSFGWWQPLIRPVRVATVCQPIRLRTLPGTDRTMFSQSGLRVSSTFAGSLVRSAPRKVLMTSRLLFAAGPLVAWGL